MITEPWWLSWLESQSHDNPSMLKVEGLNPGVGVDVYNVINYFCLRMRVNKNKNKLIRDQF